MHCSRSYKTAISALQQHTRTCIYVLVLLRLESALSCCRYNANNIVKLNPQISDALNVYLGKVMRKDIHPTSVLGI